jgi:hypothetical protein
MKNENLRVEGKAAGIYTSCSIGAESRTGSVIHFPLGNFPLGGSPRFSGGGDGFRHFWR